jgi:hypothetical protein
VSVSMRSPGCQRRRPSVLNATRNTYYKPPIRVATRSTSESARVLSAPQPWRVRSRNRSFRRTRRFVVAFVRDLPTRASWKLTRLCGDVLPDGGASAQNAGRLALCELLRAPTPFPGADPPARRSVPRDERLQQLRDSSPTPRVGRFLLLARGVSQLRGASTTRAGYGLLRQEDGPFYRREGSRPSPLPPDSRSSAEQRGLSRGH